jgi:ferrous iron transport protein B
VVLALTMNDLAQKKGIKVDIAGLQSDLGIPVVAVDARKNKGLGELKKVLGQIIETPRSRNQESFIDNKNLAPAAIDAFKKTYPTHSDYAALHYLMHQ